MLTPGEAERLVLDSMLPAPREDCPLLQANGRVLRRDLVTDRDLPPFDRVTMDGYALRTAALANGTHTFRVEATQAAGVPATKLSPAIDACIEIMTGAVLPEGADGIIPYEETAHDATKMTVSDSAGSFPAGHAIHRRGSDRRAGDVMVRAGTRLTGREIAVAAACGYATVSVSQLPKIAVVSTGDELVEVEAPVAPHQIRRSNDYGLRAMLAAAGYPNAARFHLRDVRQEIEHLLWHVVAEFDVVILAGGVSKGKFDYLPEELARLGVKKGFQGVAQRPGKPLWFGVSARNTPVFALPGNPVSAFTCLHRYVLPALDRASGLAVAERQTASLGEAVTLRSKLTYFLPVKLGRGPHAELLAWPDPINTSGDFAALVGTDGFVELSAAEREFPTGTIVPYWPWF